MLRHQLSSCTNQCLTVYNTDRRKKYLLIYYTRRIPRSKAAFTVERFFFLSFFLFFSRANRRVTRGRNRRVMARGHNGRMTRGQRPLPAPPLPTLDPASPFPAVTRRRRGSEPSIHSRHIYAALVNSFCFLRAPFTTIRDCLIIEYPVRN